MWSLVKWLWPGLKIKRPPFSSMMIKSNNKINKMRPCSNEMVIWKGMIITVQTVLFEFPEVVLRFKIWNPLIVRNFHNRRLLITVMVLLMLFEEVKAPEKGRIIKIRQLMKIKNSIQILTVVVELGNQVLINREW